MTPVEPAYRYRASLRRVRDGDTFIADVDLGFFASTAVIVRLAGVDTPELHSRDARQRDRAAAAAAFLHQLLAPGDEDEWGSKTAVPLNWRMPLVLASHKDARSFERWVCDVWLPDGRSVADAIIAAGQGVAM